MLGAQLKKMKCVVRELGWCFPVIVPGVDICAGAAM